MLRWKSTRDNFIRNVRKTEQSNQVHLSRTRHAKTRKSFYHDNQLNFLLKNRKLRFSDTVSADTIKPDMIEFDDSSDSMVVEVQEPIYVDVADGLLHEQFEATQDSGSPLNVFDNVTEAPGITATAELFSEQRSINYPEEHVEEPGPSSQASVVPKTINEDEHFFHSMLPSVLKLSASQKMRFRIKVMQAMLEVQQNIMWSLLSRIWDLSVSHFLMYLL